MEHVEIKALLMNTLELDAVHVSGNGTHFQVIAVSNHFTGMSRVKKQQMIYAPLMEYISDNRIHALSIQTYTQEEWDSHRTL
ncbi:BolA family iron metabolism protein IbaG [Candidatus Steffania adelgidicola]|uniref:BolA family iron metabolism protein IbaG n=1 Tax=Candidatus Steffania adelgidicola TaxID=1076626 RepID=UPI001D022879|nr:BolA family iron metabolism protein IbaG [Candidatus Steffania adelgidicola]UDG80151.1 Acid stress protein IbaG [Candidatus Steffania adelgidicola]